MSNPHEEHHDEPEPTTFQAALQAAIEKQLEQANTRQETVLAAIQEVAGALRQTDEVYVRLEKKIDQTEERLNAAWAELAGLKKARPSPALPKLSFWGRHKKAMFTVAGTLVGAGVSGTIAYKAAEKVVEKRQNQLGTP